MVLDSNDREKGARNGVEGFFMILIFKLFSTTLLIS